MNRNVRSKNRQESKPCSRSPSRREQPHKHRARTRNPRGADGRDRAGRRASRAARAQMAGALDRAGAARPRQHVAVWRASIARSLGALLRWWGWIEPLHLGRIEEQLLLAWLLDSAELNAVARVWASARGCAPTAWCPSATRPTGPAAPRASSAGSVLEPSMPTRGCSSPPGSGTNFPCRPASPRPSSAVSSSWGHCRRGCRSGSACAERTKSRSGPPCETADLSPGSIARSPRPPSSRPRPTCRNSTTIAPAGSSRRTSLPRRWHLSATPIPASAGGIPAAKPACMRSISPRSCGARAWWSARSSNPAGGTRQPCASAVARCTTSRPASGTAATCPEKPPVTTASCSTPSAPASGAGAAIPTRAGPSPPRRSPSSRPASCKASPSQPGRAARRHAGLYGRDGHP